MAATANITVAEGQSSIPSTYVRLLTTVCNTAPGGPDTLHTGS